MSHRWLIVPLLLVYVLHLGGVGLLGPDEPRYASVGREMAHSGNLITPKLDGQPWFEKPPLLYWMTAIGHWAHLPDEWASRLPVALASIIFLTFFGNMLEREFSRRVALMAVAILSTTAGWVAYSFAALTDLGMSITFSAAMLITLFDTRSFDEKLNRGWIAGALLGLSILAKGFVPLVLFAPLLLIARGKRITILGGAILVAAPWHLLCLAQNGSAFWNDYFWRQHVARFFTPALEHVQPFWYYLPVLLAGLFPWTPLVALVTNRKNFDDVRIRVFAGWIVYGFLFFSAATNKLPGYILPLLPAVAIVLAASIEKARKREVWLASCAALLALLPTVAAILPGALLAGIGRTSVTFAYGGLLFLAVSALVWWLAREGQTELAVVAVALAAACGVVYMKYAAFPILDRQVSARAFWRMNRQALERAARPEGEDSLCLDQVRRSWEYGLNYYTRKPLRRCGPEDSKSPRVKGLEDVLSIVVP